MDFLSKGSVEPAIAPLPSGEISASLLTIAQTNEITLELLDEAQQIRRDGNRLRPLKVRISGHNVIGIFGRLGDKGFLQVGDFGFQKVNLVPQPEAQVRCDLVVSAAARVQLLGGVADFSESGRSQSPCEYLRMSCRI